MFRITTTALAVIFCVWLAVGINAVARPAARARARSISPQPVATKTEPTPALAPATTAAPKPTAAPVAGGATQSQGSPRPLAGEGQGVRADAPQAPSTALEANAESPASASKSTLTPEQAALKDRIRKTVLLHFRRPMNMAENTPAEILQGCLAFGCDAVIRTGQSTATANAIGCLCWNYPCAGYRLLSIADGNVVSRIGYGLQQQPGEFLAVLAQAAVPADYEIRVGDEHRAVKELIEAEQRDCRAKTDQSQRLIGLAFYVDDNSTWKNDLGEEWSIARMVAGELDRESVADDARSTDRLMGLSMAVTQRAERKRALDGEFQRADAFLKEFQQHALKLQNSDGSWHPTFFARQGASNDRIGVLNSTGRILEWLALSLPEDQLQDPAMVRSVNFVNSLLNDATVQQSAASRTLRGIGATMHGLRALGIYDRRALGEKKGEG